MCLAFLLGLNLPHLSPLLEDLSYPVIEMGNVTYERPRLLHPILLSHSATGSTWI